MRQQASQQSNKQNGFTHNRSARCVPILYMQTCRTHGLCSLQATRMAVDTVAISLSTNSSRIGSVFKTRYRVPTTKQRHIRKKKKKSLHISLFFEVSHNTSYSAIKNNKICRIKPSENVYKEQFFKHNLIIQMFVSFLSLKTDMVI